MNIPARIEQVLKFSDALTHRQVAAILGHDIAAVCVAFNNMLKQGRVRVAHYERSPGKPVAYYDLKVHLPNAKKPKAMSSTVKGRKWRAVQKPVILPVVDHVFPAWMR
jgi:hypothetical protein